MRPRIPWTSRKEVTPIEIYQEVENVVTNINRLQSDVDSLKTSVKSQTGSYSIGNLNIRSESGIVIAEGSNTISFKQPMSSVNYSLSVFAKYADNTNIQLNETGKTQSGFTVYASDAGTLEYTAVEIL